MVYLCEFFSTNVSVRTLDVNFRDPDGGPSTLPFILGIVIAVLVLIVVVYAIAHCIRRRRRIASGD